MPYEATASRVWYEAIMAEAQRRGISVLLTGKCGNFTVSWHGNGLVRSLSARGDGPRRGVPQGTWRQAAGFGPPPGHSPEGDFYRSC